MVEKGPSGHFCSRRKPYVCSGRSRKRGSRRAEYATSAGSKLEYDFARRVRTTTVLEGFTCAGERKYLGDDKQIFAAEGRAGMLKLALRRASSHPQAFPAMQLALLHGEMGNNKYRLSALGASD
jgi:hypothetical protein